jgi:hypothetical protein
MVQRYGHAVSYADTGIKIYPVTPGATNALASADSVMSNARLL